MKSLLLSVRFVFKTGLANSTTILIALGIKKSTLS